MSKDNLTLDDLKEYIKKKSKEDSLDTALLFISSSVSLLLTNIISRLVYASIYWIHKGPLDLGPL
jgi:hypothetical protein